MKTFCLWLVGVASLANGAAVTKATSISLYGTAKYAKSMDHFPFANPNAPKGGTIVMGTAGGFDSLNEYALKGNSAPGLGYLTDPLMLPNPEEPMAHYCLICETIEYPADRSYVIFHLNSRAKFQDGLAITADDVAFTFNALTKNFPQYRAYYADVAAPEVIDARTVRFNFKKINNELAVIIGELPVLSKKFWTAQDLTKTTLQPPVGSGPYKIKSVDTGRSITYERDANYWAKDHPLRKGFFNFQQMRYDVYHDDDVALEAFKGGAYDFRVETVSKNWAQGYESEGLRNKQMIKDLVPNNAPLGAQGFAFNLRRPIFKDVRVRQALNLLFDFEWMNKNLFYNAYKRSKSYFENSTMAARGLPKGQELTILKKYQKQLPAEVFSKEFSVPVNSSEDERRANTKLALQLFESAGWKINGGLLKNAKGEAFSFEFLTPGGAFDRVVLAYQNTLHQAGIELRLRRVDTAQYINRMRDFDFDMSTVSQGESDSPGNEQRGYWGSAAAKEKGSRNFAGIENPVIDTLIDGLIQAKTFEGLTAFTRALDRVLLWNHYQIHNWHFPFLRVAYWAKFGRPEKNPARGLSVDTWWLDVEKDAALKKARS